MHDLRYDEILTRNEPGWRFRGGRRPGFARPTGPGQESVWDYPRPPVVVVDTRHVTVELGGIRLADSRATLRLLETASPPTFYIPRRDVATEYLSPARASSFCEWKGQACYWDVRIGGLCRSAAVWGYPEAGGRYAELADCMACYPGALVCHVDGERVAAQPGGFYGGWVTHEIVGPYKGEPGTLGW